MAAIFAHRDSFLHPVARAVGGPAIREATTVGGNLFAPTPYGDFATACLARRDGQLAGGFGQREVPLEEFLGRRERESALVASVAFKRPLPGAFRFVKVTRVHPKGISVLSISAQVPASSGRITGARIAYGAMAPTPVRAKAAERALEGRSLDAAGIAPALAALPKHVAGRRRHRQRLVAREILPIHLRRLLSARSKHEARMKTPLQFRLNGEDVATFAEGGAICSTLREGVGDLSVKGGCWQGTCGTCTVLIDGVPRVSCVTLAETLPANRSRPSPDCATAPICIRCRPLLWNTSPRNAAIARREC